jgi:hypothetical protein
MIKNIPRYPASIALAPFYIVICGRSGSAISLTHYLKIRKIYREKLLNIERVFLSSLKFWLKHFSFQEALSDIVS